jgi:lipopolysaccharide/colanic/teichoic acid biosynthesis glycosyltransferase
VRDGGRAVRRVIDAVVAAVGLVVGAPVLASIAAVVRLWMGPPVLFRQRRSGKDGVEFDIVKFRSMRAPRYAGEPDTERVTAMGQRLRSTSLDELPQLWNVLRGDMSLIGPRPTLPEQVVHYSTRQRGRLAVRPGITGWAQVTARNSLSWPERIELDLWYIENRSLRLDLRVVALTLVSLVRPRGITAEGGINPGFPVPDRPVPDLPRPDKDAPGP